MQDLLLEVLDEFKILSGLAANDSKSEDFIL